MINHLIDYQKRTRTIACYPRNRSSLMIQIVLHKNSHRSTNLPTPSFSPHIEVLLYLDNYRGLVKLQCIDSGTSKGTCCRRLTWADQSYLAGILRDLDLGGAKNMSLLTDRVKRLIILKSDCPLTFKQNLIPQLGKI